MLFDRDTILFLKIAVEKDGFIELPAYGNSMFPLIQRGNVCRFVPCNTGSLVKGDIILFHTDQGQLVAHRFTGAEMNADVRHYLFKGDTNLGHDMPVTAEQIIGKLALIRKKSHEVSMEDFSPGLWGKLILGLPILSSVLRKYLDWKNHYQNVWSKLWLKSNS